MSFGFSLSDGLMLIQLVWSTYDGAKRACSEHGELTREIHSLCTVLDHLKSEDANPDSLIHQAKGSRRRELKGYIKGCERHLRRINAILTKFNSLAEEERSGTQLWEKVRFSNGPVKDVLEIRQKILTYTTAISMSLHLLSQGSQGRMEKMISRQGGEMKGIRKSINLLLAKPSATHEGSVFSNHSQDDITWWRDFRHNLVKSGYTSKALSGNMELIQAYVKELTDRGVFEVGINGSHLSLGSYSDAEEVTEVAELPATAVPSITRVYPEELVLNDQNLAQGTSEIAQRLGCSEAQLLHAINGGNERAKNGDGSKSNQPSATNNFETDRENRPVSPMTESEGEAEDTSPQSPKKSQLSVAEFLSMLDRGYVQENAEPLDKEALAKLRAEAFSALPTEERKKIITLQDPSERRYSFPYYLVTRWDVSLITSNIRSKANIHSKGMKYLTEEAFVNNEDLNHHVSKGEYDLINSDGAVIIPKLWETFVEPDMAITMAIWPIRKLSIPTTPIQDIFPSYSPLPRPRTEVASNTSNRRSYPKSSSASTSTSITKSTSKSSDKPTPFWWFLQRPKPKKRPRSLPRWSPPPPRGWPPTTSFISSESPSPPSPPPSVYAYTLPLRPYTEPKPSQAKARAVKLKSKEPQPSFSEATGSFYPTTNEEGAPIFELE